VGEHPDPGSVVQLRQRILDEWPEGENKDRVTGILDALLVDVREGAQEPNER
jgi:hypothetical protein